MTINVFFILVIAFFIGKIVQGHIRGMVKEVISFVSLLIISLVIALLANGLRSYLNKEIISLVVTVILIGVIIVAHSFIGVFFLTAKVIVKLPIVHWLDKTMGILMGALEAVVFLWILYYFTIILDMGSAGTWILESTKENSILTFFFNHNLIVDFLQKVGISNLTKLL